ncbi:MAG: SAM-dependent methyltransferase [Zoogloeaceae bacterium]|jgi:16S rRNA (cytidine1402-2'-O)-methyltransferase|nr:SAM-dependent methyltransferase [Zoogloeaceae bacterium]
MDNIGALYLIPVPLCLAPDAPSLHAALPAPALAKMRELRHFVVEQAKSARAVLKCLHMPVPLQELLLAELNEHTPKSALPGLLDPLLQGQDMGLMSEAGCPAVADPGAQLVALAQRRGIRVVPLIGPSSLLLALMASGLNGQRFAFHGYLPAKAEERGRTIRALEKESRLRQQTQIFIETPYRNLTLFTALLQHARSDTLLCLATDLTLPDESIRTHTIRDWRAQPLPDCDRRPAVFVLLAGSESARTAVARK